MSLVSADMLTAAQRDILYMFDVISANSQGMQAVLAAKMTSEEGDLLYRACEEAQNLLATTELSQSMWASLGRVYNIFMQLVEAKLGRKHHLCSLRGTDTDAAVWQRFEALENATGDGYIGFVSRLIDNGTMLLQGLHPRLSASSAFRLN